MTIVARTLLLIESDDAYRAALAAAFAAAGYRVLASPDGLSAISHVGAETSPLALVLLDWGTPTRDGLELVNALADDPTHDATPLIVLADVASTAHIPSTRVAAVVSKPVRTRWLLRLVDRLSIAREPDARAHPQASTDHPTAMHRRPREVDLAEIERTSRVRR
ncbi:MAG: response regulator [Deltaproteobacteria bacterium]|nr:response regulator [Deltaproteobacteria bacterium]